MTTCLRCHSLQAAAASSIAASAGQLNFTTKSVARSPGSSPVRDPAGIHQLSDFIPAFSPSSEPASFNSVFSYNTLFEQTSSADSTRTCKHAQFRFFQVRQLRLRQWKLQLQFQRHQLPGQPLLLAQLRLLGQQLELLPLLQLERKLLLLQPEWQHLLQLGLRFQHLHTTEQEVDSWVGLHEKKDRRLHSVISTDC